MTSPSQVMEATERFVRENFLYTRPDLALHPDTPLLGRGIIDSTGVMELILFLEESFGVTLEDEEITEDHLGTLGAIGETVIRKLERAEGLHAA